MNGQVNYIIHASFILAIAAGTIFLFQKIPLDISSESIESTALISTTPKIEVNEKIQAGKKLFMAHCASCHHLTKVLVGPALGGFEQKQPWTDSAQIYQWIRNPALFMEKDNYTRQLKQKFETMMTPFPTLSKEDIDAIRAYIRNAS